MLNRKILFALVIVAIIGSAAYAVGPIELGLKTFKWKAEFEGGDTLGGYNDGENKFFMYVNGTATDEVAVAEDGDYTVSVEASCDEAKNVFATFQLTIGDVVVAKGHSLTTQAAKVYTFPAKLKKGKQNLTVAFLNDEFKEGEFDRNLYLHAIKLERK